jgi:hypothetical protein
MDFCDGDTPWGHVGRVQQVLDFVCQALCWPALKDSIELNPDQNSGLNLILLACSQTLQKAEQEAKKEDNGSLAICNGTMQHPHVQYL